LEFAIEKQSQIIYFYWSICFLGITEYLSHCGEVNVPVNEYGRMSTKSMVRIGVYEHKDTGCWYKQNRKNVYIVTINKWAMHNALYGVENVYVPPSALKPRPLRCVILLILQEGGG
jgi:hypothetical protein